MTSISPMYREQSRRDRNMKRAAEFDAYFQNKIYRIPDYQRGYAWQDLTALWDFWEDVINLQSIDTIILVYYL